MFLWYSILFHLCWLFQSNIFGNSHTSFIWEENRNNFFFRCKCIHFFFPCLLLYIIKQGLHMILYSLFIFFPFFFFFGSKINLIIAFEVFFLHCSFLCFFFFFFAPKECTTIYVVC